MTDSVSPITIPPPPLEPIDILEAAHVMHENDADAVRTINSMLDDPAALQIAAKTHSSLLVRLLAARLVPLEFIDGVAMARRGRIYSLPRPADYKALMHFVFDHLRLDAATHPCSYGYTTSRGRFVGPAEALVVARAAGQLVKAAAGRKNLYPTDIW